MRGALATFGYSSKEMDVARELEGVMQVNKQAYLIDTRLVPWCTWSKRWQRPTLKQHYGNRYLWKGDWLGNVNHAQPDRLIQLADEQQGLPWLVHGLEKGFTLILLCGCSTYETCHRKVLYDKVTAQYPLPTYTLGQRVLTPCGAGVINPSIPLEVHRARNRYGVILEVPGVQRYFFPNELQAFDVTQQCLMA
jgi:hypothetical protein